MNIAFLMYPERGGVYPTFHLAKKLIRRGHRVIYFGLREFEKEVQAQGLSYITVMTEEVPIIDPTETVAMGSSQAKEEVRQYYSSTAFRESLRMLSDGSLLKCLRQDSIDLVMLDALLNRAWAPKLRKGGFQVVQIQTSLIGTNKSIPPITSGYIPSGRSVNSFLRTRTAWLGTQLHHSLMDNPLSRALGRAALKRTVAVEARMLIDTADLTGDRDAKYIGLKRHLRGRGYFFRLPEIILCPAAFDYPAAGEKWIHAGPCVDLHRNEDPFPLDPLSKGRKVVYVSLGTHVFYYSAAETFLGTALAAASTNPDLFFVIAVGKGRKLEAFRAKLPVPVSDNVLLTDFVPQVCMLRQSSVMVTNGGLGTIKECILNRVPMLVVPCAFDQEGNAARVVFHGLGLRHRISSVSASELSDGIRQCLTREDFKLNLAKMAERFEDPSELNHALEWIENGHYEAL
jgi:zeaxanthin glucosyltransferase